MFFWSSKTIERRCFMENQENKVVDENTENKSTGKNFKPAVVVGVLLLIAAAGLGTLFLRKNNIQSQQVQVQAESTNNVSNANVKEFIIDGSNFKFEPSQIKVSKGDTVKITFKDNDGTHNLVVDGYNVSTRILSEGQDTIQFVADKTGTFEYYCSIGSHRDLGMKGTLTVE